MIAYKQAHLTVAEAWFGEEPVRTGLDIVLHIQRSTHVSGAYCRAKHTMLLDLTPDEEALRKALDARLRREVRRAAEEGLVCERLDPSDARVRHRFYAFYDQWVAQKGLHALPRGRLDKMAQVGCLDLSSVRSAEGEMLACNADYIGGSRARGMYCPCCLSHAGTSAERQFMGRARRYLIWCNILRFKRDGYAVFDFGGWYDGGIDQHLLQTNAFKKDFGGRVVQEWNCDEGVSLPGKLALWARRYLGRTD